MSLLPVFPFLAAALFCVAAIVPPGPAAALPGAIATPALHRVSADTQWRRYLLVGPGPVFRHVERPMRG